MGRTTFTMPLRFPLAMAAALEAAARPSSLYQLTVTPTEPHPDKAAMQARINELFVQVVLGLPPPWVGGKPLPTPRVSTLTRAIRGAWSR
jgi:hypothetical protein